MEQNRRRKTSILKDKMQFLLTTKIITRRNIMIRKQTHPGEVFLKDVLEPLGINITDAAKMLGVTRKTLSEFVNEKSSLSPEMAIRIAKATSTSPESWMTMQMKLTLWQAFQHEPENVELACFA